VIYLVFTGRSGDQEVSGVADYIGY